MLSGSIYAREQYDVKVETNVAMKTRDGITLRADIYRPEAPGRFPVILQRTPYDKRNDVATGLRFAANGFVFVDQDVRGRNASEGDWYPFKYESQDGYDAVEWASELPYSDGKVGLFGGSYVGATQMLAAVASPPHLVGIMPFVTATDYYEDWAYQGGAFQQLLAQAWSSALALDGLTRRAAPTALPTHWNLMTPPVDYPLLNPGTSSVGLANYYFDWIDHPTDDEYWKQWSIQRNFDKIKIPALVIGGWYDLFQDGSLRTYMGIKSKGGSEAARSQTRLIMIVGGHAGGTQTIGDIDFGKKSVPDITGLAIEWYNYLLKGVDSGISKQPRVKLFVMGKDEWRNEDDWPLARAKNTSYYLHSNGKANTLSGDGTLSTTSPEAEPSDQYVYDPDQPVPTYGGAVLGDTIHYPPGPLDQRAVETRPDVLVYTTPAFPHDTEVTGHVILELYVSSSAVDTDFVGKLVDVWPNGKAENLTDGILRARYRASDEKPELMNPGEVYKLTIDLWSTSNVFLAGHKLRLEIESSNFPRFDRNLNNGLSPETSTSAIKATNVVYHDKAHPSVLILPVIP
jgi:putative CocE/NonD family hydrolase